jgi:hypothetical protein
MTKTLKHNVRLVLGDWSGDGHEKTSVQFFASNLRGSEIQKAYNAGTKIVGFDLSENVARKYGDNSISIENVNKLKELGCKVFDNPNEYEFDEKKGYSIWTTSFTDIYLFICKLGNPEFEYEFVFDPTDSINIGGYGLFNS